MTSASVRVSRFLPWVPSWWTIRCKLQELISSPSCSWSWCFIPAMQSELRHSQSVCLVANEPSPLSFSQGKSLIPRLPVLDIWSGNGKPREVPFAFLLINSTLGLKAWSIIIESQGSPWPLVVYCVCPVVALWAGYGSTLRWRHDWVLFCYTWAWWHTTVIPVLLRFRQEAVLGLIALSKQTHIKRRKGEHTVRSYCG